MTTRESEIGQEVRIRSGPLEGFRGTVEQVDETGSPLKVSLLLYGRTTLIEFHAWEIEPVVRPENAN
jgi:transcriptional antiterminator NusG